MAIAARAAAHPGRSQSVVLVELAELIAEAHLVELVNCSRSEAVPAHLFAWERFAFDDRDVVAVTSEPVCGRGAGRAAADDQYVNR